MTTSLDPDPLASAGGVPRAWRYGLIGAGAILALGSALLWMRYGPAVFVDALGVVASCF